MRTRIVTCNARQCAFVFAIVNNDSVLAYSDVFLMDSLFLQTLHTYGLDTWFGLKLVPGVSKPALMLFSDILGVFGVLVTLWFRFFTTSFFFGLELLLVLVDTIIRKITK